MTPRFAHMQRIRPSSFVAAMFTLLVLCRAAEERVSCPTSRTGKSGARQCTSLVQMRSLTSRAPAPTELDSFDDDEDIASQINPVNSMHDGAEAHHGDEVAALQHQENAAPQPQHLGASRHGKADEASAPLVLSQGENSSAHSQDRTVSKHGGNGSAEFQSSGKRVPHPHQANETTVSEQHFASQSEGGDTSHSAGATSMQRNTDRSSDAQNLLTKLRTTGSHVMNSSLEHGINTLSHLPMLIIQQMGIYGRIAMLHAGNGSTSMRHAMLLELREPPKAPTIFLAFGLFTLLALGSLFLCFVAVGGEQGEPERRKIQEPANKASVTGPMPASFLTMQRKDDALSVSTRTSAGTQFCPELVVPSGRECVLLVPMVTMIPNAATENEEHQVADLRGNPVLRVSLSSGTRTSVQQSIGSVGGSVLGDGGKITLMAAGTGEVLAYCISRGALDGIDRPPAKKKGGEFAIYHASGDLFGNIQGVCLPDWDAPEERYVLSSACGRLHFWGSFEDFALNVTDDQGVLLATTERCAVDFATKSEFFRLRVAPLADVGLILCGLLSLSKLEMSRAAQTG